MQVVPDVSPAASSLLSLVDIDRGIRICHHVKFAMKDAMLRGRGNHHVPSASSGLYERERERERFTTSIQPAMARSSLQVWVCHLPFQVAVFAMLITLLFARPCWPETCLYGGAFTFRHVVLPLRVPSFAPICGGLRGRAGLARSPIMSCLFQ